MVSQGVSIIENVYEERTMSHRQEWKFYNMLYLCNLYLVSSECKRNTTEEESISSNHSS